MKLHLFQELLVLNQEFDHVIREETLGSAAESLVPP